MASCSDALVAPPANRPLARVSTRAVNRKTIEFHSLNPIQRETLQRALGRGSGLWGTAEDCEPRPYSIWTAAARVIRPTRCPQTVQRSLEILARGDGDRSTAGCSAS